jgi:group I intron endonuclease
MSNAVVYGIIDPISNQLRYIGQTVNFNKRKSEHYRTAITQRSKARVYKWLRSLYNKSIIPIFLILEECSIEVLDETEIFYIDYFKMLGCNLTNTTEGGKSKRGYKHSEKMKEKMSIIMKGNSWNKGKKLSKEHRQNISLSSLSRKHTNISKLKMSQVKIKHKTVVQSFKDGRIIKVFSSAYQASKELNINRKAIGNVLANRAIKAGGYRWTYY